MRAPVACVLKRSMRQKAPHSEPTFGFAEDVKEVHQQIPIHGVSWRQLGSGTNVLVRKKGDFRGLLGFLSPDLGGIFDWEIDRVSDGTLRDELADASCR